MEEKIDPNDTEPIETATLSAWPSMTKRRREHPAIRERNQSQGNAEPTAGSSTNNPGAMLATDQERWKPTVYRRLPAPWAQS